MAEHTYIPQARSEPQPHFHLEHIYAQGAQVDQWGETPVDYTERPEWWPYRACNNPRIDPNIFFPASGDSTTKAAKAVCSTCPVMLECHEYGMGDRYGIWGGLSENERKAERRRRNIADGKPVGGRNGIAAICGTDGGYYRHRRFLKEEPCGACKAAHTAAEMSRPADKRRRAAVERDTRRRNEGWCRHCAHGWHAKHFADRPCTCPKCAAREDEAG